MDAVWNVSKYGFFSGPYFPAFGLNTERYFVSLRTLSECGKIRTRQNSVFGHNSRSEMIIVKDFSVDSIKSEFWNKETVEFQWFFVTSNIWNISDMAKVWEIRANTPSVSLFETFASNRSFIFVTIAKLPSNEIRETFCEGLKWMCKLFEINAQQDF